MAAVRLESVIADTYMFWETRFPSLPILALVYLPSTLGR